MKTKSIVFKLSLILLTLSSIIFLAVFITFYYSTEQALLKDMEEDAKNISMIASGKIDNILQNTSKIPHNLATTLETMVYSEKQIEDLIRNTLANNREIFGSCISFEPYAFKKDKSHFAPYYFKSTHGIAFKDLAENNYNYFDWDWYKMAKNSDEALWSEPYFDKGGGNIIMSTYSVPFYKNRYEKKSFNGVVTIDISLEWLQKYISSIKILNSGYTFLISGEGKVIAHPQKDLILNESIFSLSEKNNEPELKEIGLKMTGGLSGLELYKSVHLKKQCWLYFTPLSSNNWSLAVVFPEDELYADLHRLSRIIIIIGILGFCLMFVMLTISAKRISNPLVKLSKATEQIGKGNFNCSLPEIRSNDEIGKLNISFHAMQEALNTYIKDLKFTTAAKEKIESELNIARNIQKSIVPHIFPPFPERKEIEIYAILEPAKAVGGDLYDYFFIDQNHLCFAIGDVSGKGVPASLFMAITSTLLRANKTVSSNVEKIAYGMNRLLLEKNDSEMFVTFFLGILNIKTGKLSYLNAGHNPPYIIRQNNNIEQMEIAHSCALGLFDCPFDKSSNTTLLPGEQIILYTDGVTEAMNISSELFDESRLEKALSVVSGKPPAETIEIIHKDVKSFVDGAEQSDDITLLVIKYNGNNF